MPSGVWAFSVSMGHDNREKGTPHMFGSRGVFGLVAGISALSLALGTIKPAARAEAEPTPLTPKVRRKRKQAMKQVLARRYGIAPAAGPGPKEKARHAGRHDGAMHKGTPYEQRLAAAAERMDLP